MAYTKQTWTDSETTGSAITATRLNNMETGIYNVHATVDSIKDYIVESGRNNNWWWKKYNSGKMHLRGRMSRSCKGGTSWGSCYYDSNAAGGWTYPVTFVGIKSSTITIEHSNGEF